MKILFDECINRRLGKEFPDHDFYTTHSMGWAGKKNGNLLSLAQEDFDVFITVDKNLQFQQNLSKFNISVIVLDTPRIDLKHLKSLVPKIQEALKLTKTKPLIVIK